MAADQDVTLDRAAVADWVSKLVQIPSVNPLHEGPKAGVTGELAMATQLADWFTDFGATVELEDVEPNRPNMYAIIEGDSDRWVGVDVHTDTVGVEHMTDPPFDGRIEDGRVYGRGSVDTKATLGIMLAVAEKLKATGRRPKDNLLVVGTISEEAGGLLGAVGFADWLRRRDLVMDQVIVAEPTMCHPVYGHKGGVGLTINVQGEAAHTSKPHLGKNAIVAAAKIILAMDAEHERLIAEPATTEVGTGTISTTIINGGTATNIVPDTCELKIGRRISPFEDPWAEYERLSEMVREAAGLPVEISMANDICSPAFYQSPETTWVRDIASWSGCEAETAPYGTNALRYEGVIDEMVVFGPGSIDVAHKAVEYVDLSELDKASTVYEQWLL